MQSYANSTVKTKQYPGRVSCKKVLSKLGADSSRSVGLKDCFRGIASSVSKFTPRVRGKNYLCKKYFSYAKYYSRGGKIVSKRCYRICPQRTGGPGLLQYLFHVSQKRWGNKINFKFKTPQCFSTKGTFQNGDSTVNNSGNATRGLGCVDRSKRFLFTHSSSCSTQTVSKVLYSQSSSPVSGNAVWLSNSPKNFHKGNGCSGGTSEMSADSYFHVPRRLVNSESVKRSTANAAIQNNQPSCRLGTPDQCRKITVHSFLDNNLSGGSVQLARGSSISIGEQIFSNSTSNSRNCSQNQGSCSSVSQNVGSNGLMYIHNTFTYALYSIIPPVFLTPTLPWPPLFGTSFTSSIDPSSMVARETLFVQGSTPSVHPSYSGTLDRRIPDGLGAHLEHHQAAGLWTEQFKQSHKSIRNAGSLECSEDFSRQLL